MKAKIIVAGLSLLAVAGCGTAAAQTHHAARPVAHVAPALPAMTHLESTQDCAALALVRTGVGSYAQEVQTVAGQSGVPQHVAAAMIARNVRSSCPSEVSVLP